MIGLQPATNHTNGSHVFWTVYIVGHYLHNTSSWHLAMSALNLFFCDSKTKIKSKDWGCWSRAGATYSPFANTDLKNTQTKTNTDTNTKAQTSTFMKYGYTTVAGLLWTRQPWCGRGKVWWDLSALWVCFSILCFSSPFFASHFHSLLLVTILCFS